MRNDNHSFIIHHPYRLFLFWERGVCWGRSQLSRGEIQGIRQNNNIKLLQFLIFLSNIQIIILSYLLKTFTPIILLLCEIPLQVKLHKFILSILVWYHVEISSKKCIGQSKIIKLSAPEYKYKLRRKEMNLKAKRPKLKPCIEWKNIRHIGNFE